MEKLPLNHSCELSSFVRPNSVLALRQRSQCGHWDVFLLPFFTSLSQIFLTSLLFCLYSHTAFREKQNQTKINSTPSSPEAPPVATKVSARLPSLWILPWTEEHRGTPVSCQSLKDTCVQVGSDERAPGGQQALCLAQMAHGCNLPAGLTVYPTPDCYSQSKICAIIGVAAVHTCEQLRSWSQPQTSCQCTHHTPAV